MNVQRLVGTSWLIHDGQRGIVVDAARKGRIEAFKKLLGPLNLQIPLLLLTHTHYDHAGSAEALRSYMSAKVIVGAAEADCLKQGSTPVPKGTYPISRLISNAGHNLVPKQTEHYDAVTQDVIAVDAVRSLSEFGFEASVLPLGAHTRGSIGLLMGDYVFTGDTVIGLGSSLYPPFADYPEQVCAVWETILDTQAAFICPGHGPMLPRERLEKQYRARFGKAAMSEAAKIHDEIQ